MLNLFDYINPVDVLIILVSLVAVFGAILLLRPQAERRDTHRIRSILKKAEQDQKSIHHILGRIQHSAEDTESVARQCKNYLEQIDKENKTSQSRAESAESTINKAKNSEQELQQISTKMEERIRHIQTYWNEQLTDTTGSVKQIRARLNQELVKIDESLLRLREQEKMAQGFTQKLLQHQKEHLASQQKNKSVASDVQAQLEKILQESTASLDVINQHQQQIDDLFNTYVDNIRQKEQQANEQFAEVFQSTDMARQEITEGLKESRENLKKIRRYEVQSNQMHHRIQKQFNQVDPLTVERLSETIELTDEMCVSLQQGLENARALLSTLETKTAEVLDANEKKSAPVSVKTGHDDRPRNLFSLRASR